MQDLSTAPLYLPAQHIAEYRVPTCFVPSSLHTADPITHAHSKRPSTRDHHFRHPQSIALSKMPYNNTPIAPSKEITGTVSLPRTSSYTLSLFIYFV